MSEFSESYHLKDAATGDGVRLLRSAGRRGFVVPERNGWVAICPEGGLFEVDPKLVEHNRGILLHYTHAEDHGWSFSLFDGTQSLGSYSCEWTEDLLVLHSFELPTVERLLGPVFSGLGDEETRRLLQPADIDELISAKPAETFAKRVGLSHFEWTSFDYLVADQERFPEVVFVE